MVGDLDFAACYTVFGNRVLEGFARSVHADYQALGGGGPGFDDVAESLRVSNRRAAYHFVQKLKLLGFEDAAPVDASLGIGKQGRDWLTQIPIARRCISMCWSICAGAPIGCSKAGGRAIATMSAGCATSSGAAGRRSTA